MSDGNDLKVSDPSVEDLLYMIDGGGREAYMKISTRFYTFYIAKNFCVFRG